MLKQHNIKVKILDMQLGYNFSDLFNFLSFFDPDVVGITSYSHLYKEAYEVAREVKSFGNYKVVFGGVHVSAVRGEVLHMSEADFAVKGEGEYTLLELCKEIEVGSRNYGKITGLIWKNSGKVIENIDRPFIQDLDSLPFPAYEEFELEKYLGYKNRSLPLTTSRGCPYGCTFCSVKSLMGTLRARSAENVINEIKHWYEKGYNNFEIYDDNFSLGMKRAKRICDLIVEEGLNITYQFNNGLRLDRVDEELLSKLKSSGCTYIQYGIEAGNEEILKGIKKGITPEQARKAIELTNKIGIKNGVNFIIGHPGETFEKAMDSVKLAETLPTDTVNFFALVPFPRTEALEWVKEHATFLYPPEIYLNDITISTRKPVFETKEFSAEERIKVLRKGVLLHRKKSLEGILGKRLANLVLHVAKHDLLWQGFEDIFYGTKIGQKILEYTRRVRTGIR
jgi:radical SAM superfamily enzyme YgiQ (UPF0313 family)